MSDCSPPPSPPPGYGGSPPSAPRTPYSQILIVIGLAILLIALLARSCAGYTSTTGRHQKGHRGRPDRSGRRDRRGHQGRLVRRGRQDRGDRQDRRAREGQPGREDHRPPPCRTRPDGRGGPVGQSPDLAWAPRSCPWLTG